MKPIFIVRSPYELQSKKESEQVFKNSLTEEYHVVFIYEEERIYYGFELHGLHTVSKAD